MPPGWRSSPVVEVLRTLSYELRVPGRQSEKERSGQADPAQPRDISGVSRPCQLPVRQCQSLTVSLCLLSSPYLVTNTSLLSRTQPRVVRTSLQTSQILSLLDNTITTLSCPGRTGVSIYLYSNSGSWT